MRYILILLLFGSLSCNSSATTAPPEELISQKKMEDLLFDLSLLKALDNSQFKRKGEDLFNNQYLLRKYGIDSVTFAQNQQYYAQNPKLLLRIYQRIDGRLERLIDSLRDKEKIEQNKLKRE